MGVSYLGITTLVILVESHRRYNNLKSSSLVGSQKSRLLTSSTE